MTVGDIKKAIDKLPDSAPAFVRVVEAGGLYGTDADDVCEWAVRREGKGVRFTVTLGEPDEEDSDDETDD